MEAAEAMVAKNRTVDGKSGVSLCDLGYCSVGVDEVSRRRHRRIRMKTLTRLGPFVLCLTNVTTRGGSSAAGRMWRPVCISTTPTAILPSNRP